MAAVDLPYPLMSKDENKSVMDQIAESNDKSGPFDAMFGVTEHEVVEEMEMRSIFGTKHLWSPTHTPVRADISPFEDPHPSHAHESNWNTPT